MRQQHYKLTSFFHYHERNFLWLYGYSQDNIAVLNMSIVLTVSRWSCAVHCIYCSLQHNELKQVLIIYLKSAPNEPIAIVKVCTDILGLVCTVLLMFTNIRFAFTRNLSCMFDMECIKRLIIYFGNAVEYAKLLHEMWCYRFDIDINK